MLGLSTTAVGSRPFSEILRIYDELVPHLQLEFLELAIGSRTPIDQIPTDLPIVIHNDWVYDLNRCRIKADLLTDRGWDRYKLLVKSHNVLAFSWHFPQRRPGVTLDRILSRRLELEHYLERPVSLEVMPDSSYFGDLTDWQAGYLGDCKLCVDLSHLNIWASGNTQAAQTYVRQLEQSGQAVSWHVSANSGFKDTHDLISADSWIGNWIQTNSHRQITYEALPKKYQTYDRADRPNNRPDKFRICSNPQHS